MTISPQEWSTMDWIAIYAKPFVLWVILVAAAVAFPALMKAIRRGL